MKRTLAILLALVLGIGALGIGAISAPPLPVDSSSPFEFIIPVVQQTTVPQGYIGIYTAEDLSNIRNNLGGNFILMNDIDLSHIDNWFPIGYFRSISITPDYIVTGGTFFFGTLDGNGFAIRNMNIHRVPQPEGEGTRSAGLFGSTLQATIRNLAIVEANISAGGGGFAGTATQTTFENLLFRGTTNGSGIAGRSTGISSSPIFLVNNTSFYACAVEGRVNAGGLTGVLAWSDDGFIERSYNRAQVTSRNRMGAGGLVGRLSVGDDRNDTIINAAIRNSYNTGMISSMWGDVGGLVGELGFYGNSIVTIENSFNTGSLTQQRYTHTFRWIIEEGEVTSRAHAGGLVGSTLFHYDSNQLILNNSYFINNVESAVGINQRFITNYDGYNWDWDIVTIPGDGYVQQNNVLAKSNSQMRQQTSFVGFDFVNIWHMPAGGFPNFSGNAVAEPTQHAITVQGGSGMLSAPAGSYATIFANIPENHRFVRWEFSTPVDLIYEGALRRVGLDGEILMEEPTGQAMFVMPNGPVIATAITEYVPILIQWINALQVGVRFSIGAGERWPHTAEQLLSISSFPANPSDATLLFTSNNPNVATVSSTGLITAVGPGVTQVIIASRDGNAQFIVNVEVTYTPAGPCPQDPAERECFCHYIQPPSSGTNWLVIILGILFFAVIAAVAAFAFLF